MKGTDEESSSATLAPLRRDRNKTTPKTHDANGPISLPPIAGKPPVPDMQPLKKDFKQRAMEVKERIRNHNVTPYNPDQAADAILSSKRTNSVTLRQEEKKKIPLAQQSYQVTPTHPLQMMKQTSSGQKQRYQPENKDYGFHYSSGLASNRPGHEGTEYTANPMDSSVQLAPLDPNDFNVGASQETFKPSQVERTSERRKEQVAQSVAQVQKKIESYRQQINKAGVENESRRTQSPERTQTEPTAQSQEFYGNSFKGSKMDKNDQPDYQ